MTNTKKIDDSTIACSVGRCVVRRRLRPGERIELSWSWTCGEHVTHTSTIDWGQE